MSVRYVLTTVLPRYTMSGARRPAPPAVAPGPVSDPPQDVTGLLLSVQANADRYYRRVMGHD